MRKFRTFVLMAAMVALFGAIGLLVGGRVGLLLALGLAAALYIVEPEAKGVRDNLFGTHPATENRIAALQGMAATMPPARRAPSALGLGRAGRGSSLRHGTGQEFRNPWA